MKILTSHIFWLCFAPLYLNIAACSPQRPYPESLPPLKTALDCMPAIGAITAAHRGTSRDWSTPENSISALKKLIEKNYLIAEIDVARLKDGTLITFHDGVWNEISTGKGAVSASNKAGLEKILLKTRRGAFTNDRPPQFSDMLAVAKNKIYLEIDFKSSVDVSQVIKTIRQHDMEQQVLLIAYTAKQANVLRKLAPDILISAPLKSARRGELVWLGKGITDAGRIAYVQKSGQYAIGRVGKAFDTRGLKTARINADILVTDYPNQYQPLTGLNGAERKVFSSCLAINQ